MAQLSEVTLSWGEALQVAQNMDKCSRIVIALCPRGDEEDKVS